jgi:hypothetical protein
MGVNRLAGIDKPVAWFISDRNRGERNGSSRAGLSMGELLLRGTFVEKWCFLKRRQLCFFSNLITVGLRKLLVAGGGHEIGS